MSSQPTVDMLNSMKLRTMASELELQLTDNSYRELGFEERLSLIVTAEWNRRQTNKIDRFVHKRIFL